MDQADQITRQTGLVPDVQAIETLLCRNGFSADCVAELKASREQERAGHRRLYELNANYAATPEEFTKVLDDAYNQRMQSPTKILAFRFKMKELMTVEEWKALSDQMLAHSSRYNHSESRPRTGY